MILMVIGHVFKCTTLNNILFCRWGRLRSSDSKSNIKKNELDLDEIEKFRADDQTGICSASRCENGQGGYQTFDLANDDSSDDLGPRKKKRKRDKRHRENEEQEPRKQQQHKDENQGVEVADHVTVRDDGHGVLYAKSTQFYLKVDNSAVNEIESGIGYNNVEAKHKRRSKDTSRGRQCV